MIIASLATLASRRGGLRRVVESILPQVDRLYVYLNGHEELPECLRHRKAVPVFSRDAGYRGAEAKLWFTDPASYQAIMMPPPDAVHFTIDDDIVYPPNYVERMVAALERHPGAVVCVHGSIFREPFESYRGSRMSVRFMAGLAEDAQVHVPGSGTMAYRLRDLEVQLRRDLDPRMPTIDPSLAVLCKRRGVPVWAIARPLGWLQYVPPPKGGTIYEQRSQVGNTGPEEDLVRENAPWPVLAPPPEATLVGGGCTPLRPRAEPPPPAPPVHFVLIVPGWNCEAMAADCLRSIAEQKPGGYTFEAHVYNDGSTDRTADVLDDLHCDERVHLYQASENKGAAFARHWLFDHTADVDPQAVMVLLDLDDLLERGALRRVAAEYARGREVWLTYGNWQRHMPGSPRMYRRGRVDFYAPSVVRERSYRTQPGFLVPPLRTFRRFLLDAVEPRHVQDRDGNWLRCATDRALMMPILEQCAAHNMRGIPNEIYRYRPRPDSSSARYGNDGKRAVAEWVATMPKVPAYAMERAG